MNEDLFIITAARLHHTEDDIIMLKRLADGITNWASLYEMGAMHGVSPLLYHTLTKNSLTGILPQGIFARFKSDFYQTVIRNTNLLQIADQAAKKVKHKIVLLKGADLTQFLYPNIGIRSMCDIDVLVEREHAESIRSILYGEHKVSPPTTVYKSKAHEKLVNILEQEAKHLAPVYYPNGRIEIHWNLFGGYQHYDLTQQAWKSIIHVDNESFLYRLSTEFMFLHLCAHVYSHANTFSCLRMYCDINELIRNKYIDIDWDMLISITEGTNLIEKIKTVLSYTYAFFETPFPEYFINKSILDKKNTILTELINGLYVAKRKAITVFLHNIYLLNNQSDKLIYIFRTILPKKEWLKEYMPSYIYYLNYLYKHSHE